MSANIQGVRVVSFGYLPARITKVFLARFSNDIDLWLFSKEGVEEIKSLSSYWGALQPKYHILIPMTTDASGVSGNFAYWQSYFSNPKSNYKCITTTGVSSKTKREKIYTSYSVLRNRPPDVTFYIRNEAGGIGAASLEVISDFRYIKGRANIPPQFNLVGDTYIIEENPEGEWKDFQGKKAEWTGKEWTYVNLDEIIPQKFNFSISIFEDDLTQYLKRCAAIYSFGKGNSEELFDAILTIDQSIIYNNLKTTKDYKTIDSAWEDINVAVIDTLNKIFMARGGAAIQGIIDIGNHIFFMRMFDSYTHVKWLCPFIWPFYSGQNVHIFNKDINIPNLMTDVYYRGNLCHNVDFKNTLGAIVIITAPREFFFDSKNYLTQIKDSVSKQCDLDFNMISLIPVFSDPREEGVSHGISLLLYGSPFSVIKDLSEMNIDKFIKEPLHITPENHANYKTELEKAQNILQIALTSIVKEKAEIIHNRNNSIISKDYNSAINELEDNIKKLLVNIR